MSMLNFTTAEAESLHAADHQLRIRLFWTVAILAMVVAGLSYYSQILLRHPLNCIDPQTGKFISGGLPNEHYACKGIYLADFSLRRPQHRMVIMLGNSVYQCSGVVERMQADADEENQGIDFFNLGLAGSGFHDHLVELGKVVKHKPDLVVVGFINLAFSSDLLGKKGGMPRFRTDCDQMAFDPEVVAALPASFYKREFTVDSACGSIASTLFPYKRLDAIIRIPVRRRLEQASNVAAWTFKAIEPGLSWNNPRLPKLNGPSRPYPETKNLLKEFIHVARTHQVPVLFIRQESGPIWATPDVMPDLQEACARYDKAAIVDLSRHFSREYYPDEVHPIKEGRALSARRHYEAVVAALNRLQSSH